VFGLMVSGCCLLSSILKIMHYFRNGGWRMEINPETGGLGLQWCDMLLDK
jgi:hypothetical protein